MCGQHARAHTCARPPMLAHAGPCPHATAGRACAQVAGGPRHWPHPGGAGRRAAGHAVGEVPGGKGGGAHRCIAALHPGAWPPGSTASPRTPTTAAHCSGGVWGILAPMYHARHAAPAAAALCHCTAAHLAPASTPRGRGAPALPAQDEFPEQPSHVRRAIALGRLQLDPLPVLAQLCGHRREVGAACARACARAARHLSTVMSLRMPYLSLSILAGCRRAGAP